MTLVPIQAPGSGIDSEPGLPDLSSGDALQAAAAGSTMTSVKKTPAACLIGWPAAHSRSPLIHQGAKTGFEGRSDVEVFFEQLKRCPRAEPV